MVTLDGRSGLGKFPCESDLAFVDGVVVVNDAGGEAEIAVLEEDVAIDAD